MLCCWCLDRILDGSSKQPAVIWVKLEHTIHNPSSAYALWIALMVHSILHIQGYEHPKCLVYGLHFCCNFNSVGKIKASSKVPSLYKSYIPCPHTMPAHVDESWPRALLWPYSCAPKQRVRWSCKIKKPVSAGFPLASQRERISKKCRECTQCCKIKVQVSF